MFLSLVLRESRSKWQISTRNHYINCVYVSAAAYDYFHYRAIILSIIHLVNLLNSLQLTKAKINTLNLCGIAIQQSKSQSFSVVTILEILTYIQDLENG